VFDFYEFLLHAGLSPHHAEGLVCPAVLSAHRSHDRFTVGRALAACDSKFIDVTLLSNLTVHRQAGVDTCKTASLFGSFTRARKKKKEKKTANKILAINTRITQYC
jgi:hypothetical protein